MRLAIATLSIFALMCANPAFSATAVHIENSIGTVHVQSRMGLRQVEWAASRGSGRIRNGDVQETRSGDTTSIICTAANDAPIDLTVTVPHTARVEVVTRSGSIWLSGLLAGARLITASGDLNVSVPWQLTRLHALATIAPRELITPKVPGVSFRTGKKEHFWALVNSRPDAVARYGDPFTSGWSKLWDRTFGYIEIMATGGPVRLELSDQQLPPNSWILPADTAIDVLSEVQNHRSTRAKTLDREDTTGAAGSGAAGSSESDDGLVFHSTVRLVTLSAAVYDQEGHPFTGLKNEDFELTEDDRPQVIAFAHSGESPLRVVLLLDLSLSTFLTRPLILKGARQFIQSAQASDKIGVYVIASGLFQVVSPLTDDRPALLNSLNQLPEIEGGSPIYDSIVLSYAQGGLCAAGERCALVVLTDGMDNQFEASGRGSRVPFRSLRSAAEEWPIPIYTIVVPYENPSLQKHARQNMRALAEASGGRIFDVDDVSKLAQAYARVNEELRSVYAIGYYPKNRSFDGSWRSIKLRVKRLGAPYRTRPGYYAR